MSVDAVPAELGYDSKGSTAALTNALTQRGFDETMFDAFDALAYGANTASFLKRFDHDQVRLTAADVSTIPLSALVVAGRVPMGDEPEAFAQTVPEFVDSLP